MISRYGVLVVLTCLVNIAATREWNKTTDRFIGLSNHLKRLTDEEAREIHEYCYGTGQTLSVMINNSDTFIHLKEPQNRILNGEVVNETVPFTAAFKTPYEMQMCGAVFITWRHLVTAGHCLLAIGKINKAPLEQQGTATTMILMAGGVCHRTGSECEEDMVELKYEFYVYDERFGILKHEDPIVGDLAIIQLTEPVPISLRHRISIACTPSVDTKIPPALTVHGWGFIDVNATAVPDQLRRITMNRTLKESRKTCLKPGVFCLASNNRHGFGVDIAFHDNVFKGDSGSGAVDMTRNPPFIHGVTSEINFGTHISMYVDLRIYSDDFCLVLNLCVPGSIPKRRYFHFDSVYYTNVENFYLMSSGELRPTNITEQEMITENCKRGLTEPSFAAAIVDIRGKYVCSATFVTQRHLITARTCFEKLIFARNAFAWNAINNTLFVLAGSNCIANDGNSGCEYQSIKLIDVDLAAWSIADRTETLKNIAIVELTDTFKGEYPKPVCIDYDNIGITEAELSRTVYTWRRTNNNGTNVETSNYKLLTRQMTVNASLSRSYGYYVIHSVANTSAVRLLDIGAALVKAPYGSLAGIIAYTTNKVYRVIPIDYFSNMLCVYLHRCPPKFDFFQWWYRGVDPMRIMWHI